MTMRKERNGFDEGRTSVFKSRSGSARVLSLGLRHDSPQPLQPPGGVPYSSDEVVVETGVEMETEC